MCRLFYALVIALGGLLASTVQAQTVGAPPTSATQPAAAAPTVAVLDFVSDSADAANTGAQISELLTAILSAELGMRLVDRTQLAHALQEHELNLTGLVAADEAVKVGKLVGAQILVTGRAFTMDQTLFITAKLIGVETTVVEGVLVKGDVAGEVGGLVIELGAKVAERLRASASRLLPAGAAALDPLPNLRQRLSNKRRPVVAVAISERHGQARRIPDPAAETEVKLLLRSCGFVVRDVPANELTEVLGQNQRPDTTAWPRGLEGVEVLIVGEGFSEYGGRVGKLVSCGARVELNAIQRADGKIAVADRTTEKAVDLSEELAGKRALERAGRTLAIRLLEHFAQTLPGGP